MAENNEQKVGYSAPQSTSGESQTRLPADPFPSEQQQKQAASTNKVHYDHTTTAEDVRDSAGTGPTIPDATGTSAANNSVDDAAAGGAAGNNATPLRDDNSSASGLSPNRAGTFPGPGTASDRGDGSVGSTPFGTGVSDNGLEATSGLDERNTSSTNTAGYDPGDDVGNPLSGSGVTGSGTPGRDNQFNEAGSGNTEFGAGSNASNETR